jgi:hypothetical protein
MFAVTAPRAIALAALAVVPAAQAELIYATTLQGTLISFDSASPNNILSGIAIQGLDSNEQVMGIDFRPATGELYALGSFSNLYTLDIGSGIATQVGGPNPFAPALNGSAFGFDFNPTVDRIRVTSNANQNLNVSPFDPNNAVNGVLNQGTLTYNAADANFGADPNITHSAYTNNFAGATTTTLYGIDAGLDTLVTQVAATGVLTTVGSLGLDIGELGGFDISGASGLAFAALLRADSSVSELYSINLATGSASLVGEIGGGNIITSMTVIIPAPGSLALFAGAALGGRARRRRE